MFAATAMAMFAMIASVSYQHHGFFTPLFHISALLSSPQAMMESIKQAMTGHNFWFSAGPGLLGLMIHMVTGAAYGMIFLLIARGLRRNMVIPAGMVYGLGVFVVSSFVALPVAAKVTGAGSVITNMAKMVGWSTFAVEHLVFGAALGLLTFAFAGVRTAEPQAQPRSPVTV